MEPVADPVSIQRGSGAHRANSMKNLPNGPDGASPAHPERNRTLRLLPLRSFARDAGLKTQKFVQRTLRKLIKFAHRLSVDVARVMTIAGATNQIDR